MKFMRIGSANRATNKKGNEFIHLQFDQSKIQQMVEGDFQKIYMFRNKYSRGEEDPEYILMGVVKETK